MVVRIAGLPDNVLGFEARGDVTADDYESVIAPAVAEMANRLGKVRFLYVLGPEFEGWSARALWDDAKLGIGHARAWERCAVVSDNDWIGHAVRLFGWMVPGDVALFGTAELDEAKAWVSA
jgi:hypothetical protein